MPRGGVMSGCSWSGWFVCPRSLRNSTNRISKQRALSRTAAGIHTSSARWSCSLRTTNTARSLWPGQSAFYATGHSRRLFGPAQGRGVRHRHVIMQWGTYSGGGKGRRIRVMGIERDSAQLQDLVADYADRALEVVLSDDLLREVRFIKTFLAAKEVCAMKCSWRDCHAHAPCRSTSMLAANAHHHAERVFLDGSSGSRANPSAVGSGQR